VTTDHFNAGYPVSFQLGGTQFGAPIGNSQDLYCNNSPCQGQFNSSYTPAAGSYQLLLGSFGNDNNFPAAVTVESAASYRSWISRSRDMQRTLCPPLLRFALVL
jgi:hypothetical protein